MPHTEVSRRPAWPTGARAVALVSGALYVVSFALPALCRHGNGMNGDTPETWSGYAACAMSLVLIVIPPFCVACIPAAIANAATVRIIVAAGSGRSPNTSWVVGLPIAIAATGLAMARFHGTGAGLFTYECGYGAWMLAMTGVAAASIVGLVAAASAGAEPTSTVVERSS